jgi:hypothetical protein
LRKCLRASIWKDFSRKVRGFHHRVTLSFTEFNIQYMQLKK